MAKDKTPRDAAGTKAANEAMDAIIHDDNDDNGAAAEAEKQGAENEAPEQQDCGDVTLSREEIEKLRSEIAKRESVPAYIVFTDAALKDMCRIKPVDIPHFLTVSGVGNAKAEKYGKEFCSCISDYLAGQKVTNG